jgi:flagellin-like hook-associated protein FlgL
MTVVGNTSYNARMVKSLVGMRSTLEDLNTQLSSGLKAQTYGGLGAGRSLALSLSTKVARLQNYTSTIDTLGVRLSTMYTSIDRMNTLTTDVAGNLDVNAFDVLSDGKTVQQKTAYNAMSEMVDLLNTSVAGSYVYGGRRTDQAPVADLSTILNGTTEKAGFLQVAKERLTADTGSDGLGHMAVGGSANNVSLARSDGTVFGVKLVGRSSTLTNTTVGPDGDLSQLDLTVDDIPAAGGALKLTFQLPDGTTKEIQLVAGDKNDATAGTFSLGDGISPDEVADNLKTVLEEKLKTLVKTDMTAASSVAASRSFFMTYNGAVPQRVAFDTSVDPPVATGLVDATEADTVMWYQGENTHVTTDGWSPRQDVTAQVDSAMTVQYGVRGNENAFAEAMANYAAVVAVDVSADDATAKAVHAATMERAKSNLSQPNDKIQSIELELVHAQSSVAVAKDRHQTLIATYGSTLDGIKNSDDTEVAVTIQALKTRMEASYSATSILYGLSLTKYL